MLIGICVYVHKIPTSGPIAKYFLSLSLIDPYIQYVVKIQYVVIIQYVVNIQYVVDDVFARENGFKVHC